MDERVCPNCGADEVEPDRSLPHRVKHFTSHWICNNCGYHGLMPKKEGEVDPEDFEPGEVDIANRGDPLYEKIFLYIFLVSSALPLAMFFLLYLR